MPYLPWVMSKFLTLGFTLAQVVAMASSALARVIGRVPKVVTLQLGAPADLSRFDVADAPVSFVNTRNNKRAGQQHLRPGGTIVAAVAFGRPYQASFSVR